MSQMARSLAERPVDVVVRVCVLAPQNTKHNRLHRLWAHLPAAARAVGDHTGAGSHMHKLMCCTLFRATASSHKRRSLHRRLYRRL